MQFLKKFVPPFLKRNKAYTSKFRNERSLLAGDDLRSPSDSPTILFATIHKAASVYVWKVLGQLAKSTNRTPVDFEGYHFLLGETEFHLDGNIFDRNGFLFGPFRMGILRHSIDREVLLQKDIKVILQLRDPRDALTSQYFSFRHSHPEPGDSKAHVRAMKEGLKDVSIEEYVMAHAGFLENLLTEYRQLFDLPNCLTLHYEDMVNRPGYWMDQITQFLNVEPCDKVNRLRSSVQREFGELENQENIESHRRQVTPGDHRKKLPDEIIDLLNSQFKSYYASLDSITQK